MTPTPLPPPRPPESFGVWLAKVIAIVAAILGTVFWLIPWIYRAWWISEHCTLILGTRVCR